jgi:hypothetical protein
MAKGSIELLFENLWGPYYKQNPQVPAIRRLIVEREGSDELFNDHIALRTYQDPRVGLEILAKVFLSLGFEEKESFELTEKHVFAKYYKHPSDRWPRVFISELHLDDLNEGAQQIIKKLINQIPKNLISDSSLCYSGRPWTLTHEDYNRLLHESEYASWMAAHGFQMNHATLSINALNTFQNLEEMTTFLQKKGFELNGQKEGNVHQIAKDTQGRVILKQASTKASVVPVTFEDGTFEVPGCYYEFIERLNGYDSFDTSNATKIMESTDVRS